MSIGSGEGRRDGCGEPDLTDIPSSSSITLSSTADLPLPYHVR